MNMGNELSSKTRVVKATFVKEMRSGLRAPLYLACLFATCIISILGALVTVFDYKGRVDEILAQYFIGYSFQYILPFLYLIILIPSAISISEERESGTWDMIAVFRESRGAILTGKILWQFFYSLLLVLTSFLIIFAVYLVVEGGVQSALLTLTPTYLSGYPPPPALPEYIVTRTFFSPIDIYIEYGVGIMVAFSILILGLAVSTVTRNKINSVSIVISIFLFIFLASEILTSLPNSDKIASWQGVVESLGPGAMFGMAVYVAGMNSYYAAPQGSHPGEISNGINSSLIVPTLHTALPFYYTILEYSIFIFVLVIILYLFGVRRP